MDLFGSLAAMGYRPLIKVAQHLAGGSLGFDYCKDARTAKKADLIAYIVGMASDDQIRAAIAAVTGAAPAQPAQPQPAQPAPPSQPQPAAPDALINEVLNLPFITMRERIGQLIAEANKPPVIQEVERIVTVEKEVERIVERVTAVPVRPITEASSVQPAGRSLCADLFGVRVTDARGDDTSVDTFDCPTVATDLHYRFDAKNLRLFLSAMKHGRWAWLYGPPGTGKTEFVAQVASRLGRPFFRIQFDGALERYELIGGERLSNGSTVWSEGQLTQALETPNAVILLDEVSFGRAEHLSMLHAVLERGGALTIPETGRVVQRASNVMICAADNTNGGGDLSGAYVGTRPQNRAFVNRFATFIKFDYLAPDIEAQLISDIAKVPSSVGMMLATFAARCRMAVQTGDIPEAPSLRVLIPWAEALSDGVPIREAFDAIVAGRLDPVSAETMQQLYAATVSETDLAIAFTQ